MSYNFNHSEQPAQQPQVNQQQAQPQITLPQALQMLYNSPASVMREAGFNIPNTYNGLSGQNGMQQIVQYLTQSGQAPQSRIMQLLQIFSGLRR